MKTVFSWPPDGVRTLEEVEEVLARLTEEKNKWAVLVRRTKRVAVIFFLIAVVVVLFSFALPNHLAIPGLGVVIIFGLALRLAFGGLERGLGLLNQQAATLSKELEKFTVATFVDCDDLPEKVLVLLRGQGSFQAWFWEEPEKVTPALARVLAGRLVAEDVAFFSVSDAVVLLRTNLLHQIAAGLARQVNEEPLAWPPELTKTLYEEWVLRRSENAPQV